MKELVGRITALDPEASETLKVIAYFDALVDGQVTSDALLRGAGILSNAVVGYQSAHGPINSRLRRFGPLGEALPGTVPGPWRRHPVGHETFVWLERLELHTNDAMVLERLALALNLIAIRSDSSSSVRRAVERLLDGGTEEQSRLVAGDTLHIDQHALCRAVAVPITHALRTRSPKAIVVTPWGVAQAAIVPAEFEINLERAGVGIAATLSEIHESWRSAIVALRCTSASNGVLRADELGSLLLLASAFDRSADLPTEVALIENLLAKHWTLGTLQALAGGESLRAVASSAGLHHSTIQARLPRLREELGFDPREMLGRTRLQLGLFLHALAHNRID